MANAILNFHFDFPHPSLIIKARILFIQNHSSFEFAFQSDINIVCIEVQCCVQVLMLCDQEPQILSQWFSAILLLCICVIHPAIKAHVLNIANFGATNQPILITACRLQISNWEILDLTFIINQHFCLLCIWFRNIHCCSQHLIGDVLLNTALLHIRVEVLPYHLFCLNEVVLRKKFSCFWKGMRLRRVRVWKQIGGFVQTLNCALRQMLDTAPK